MIKQVSTKEAGSYSIPGNNPVQRAPLAQRPTTENCKSHVSEELDKLGLSIEEMLKMVYYVKDKLAPVLSDVEPNNEKISSGPISSSPLVLALAGLREKLESAHDILEDTASRLDI